MSETTIVTLFIFAMGFPTVTILPMLAIIHRELHELSAQLKVLQARVPNQ